MTTLLGRRGCLVSIHSLDPLFVLGRHIGCMSMHTILFCGFRVLRLMAAHGRSRDLAICFGQLGDLMDWAPAPFS